MRKWIGFATLIAGLAVLTVPTMPLADAQDKKADKKDAKKGEAKKAEKEAATGSIEIYKAKDGFRFRIKDAEGIVRHGEFKIGNSPFMFTDESAEYPEWQSPLSRGGTPVHIYLYVEDVDAVFSQAIAAGAKELLPVKDQFYGDRSGGITDPYGHIWYIATHKEDVSAEEIQRRAAAQH